MSTSVDNRVVQMRFDNAQFEQGAQKSISTMEKLKSLMNFESSVKGLDKLNTASQNVRFDGIANGVERITDRFSALGIVGMTALQNITNSAVNLGKRLLTAIPKQIMTGGWTRATNIENAKFQLEGLGVAWEKISEDLDYGVKDTAYGLDEAAVVASQLVASQVEVGDSMKQALRAVSGVAAMTNSSYGDIGRIFTTVAGQGRLMADQLNQLASRGMNAAAVLAKHLGVTEQEVRDMTSKGKIDFATFAEAMDDAFGEHAKEANKTFNGAFSNMKAALNRIGADFATPLRNNMRDVFNSIKPVIDAIRKGLVPTVKIASELMEKVSGTIVKYMNETEKTRGGIIQVVTTIANKFATFLSVLEKTHSVMEGIAKISILPPNLVGQLKRLETSLKSAFLVLTKSFLGNTENESVKKNVENLKNTFRGLVAVFSILGSAISFIVERGLDPLSLALRSVLEIVLAVMGPLGELAVNAERAFGAFLRRHNSDLFLPDSIVDKICNGINRLKDAFAGLSKVKIKLPSFKPLIDFFSSIKLPSLEAFNKSFVSFFTALGQAISGFTNAIGSSGALGVLLSGALGLSIANLVKGVGNTIDDATGFKALSRRLQGTFRDVEKVLTIFGSQVSATFMVLQNTLKADILMKIAKAIAILAAACFVLASTDASKLMAASVSIIFLMNGLLKSMKTLSLIDTPKNIFKLNSIATSMTITAVAVLILAGAVKKLGSLKFDEIIKGVGSVAALMYILAKVTESMSKNAVKLGGTAVGLLIISVAIRVLSGAIRKLGALDFDQLAQGLIGVGAALIMFAGFAKMINGTKLGVGTGLAMIEIAAAMLVLGAAIDKISKFNWEDLAKGGAALAGFLGFVAIASRLASGAGKLLALGLTMILVTTSITILAKALQMIADIPSDGVTRAGIVVGAFLLIATGIMAVSSFLNPGKMLGTAAAILVLSIAISVMSKAMQGLAKLDWKGMAVALGTLAGTFIIIGAAAFILAPVAGIMLIIGAAVLTLGSGILFLVTALGAMVAGGTALASGLTIILNAIASMIPVFISQLVTGITQGILQLLEAITSIGPALIQAGITLLTSLCEGILTTAPLIATTLFQLIVTSLVVLSNGISLIVGTLVVLIINGINALANAIRDNSEAIMAAVRNILSSIIELILEAIATILELIPGVGGKLADGVRGAKDKVREFLAPESLEQDGKEMASGVASGIRDGSSEVESASSELGLAALSGLSMDSIVSEIQNGSGNIGSILSENLLASTDEVESASSELGDSASSGLSKAKDNLGKVGTEAGSAFAKNLGNKESAAKTSGKTVAAGGASGAGSKNQDYRTAGEYAGEGFARGLESKSIRASNAGKAVAQAALNSMQSTMEEQSPSKATERLGAFGSIGFANGLTSMSGLVTKTATSVATDALDSMESVVMAASNPFSGDYEPKITPVIDMSEINKEYGSISTLFDSKKAIDMSANMSTQMDANNAVLTYIDKLDAANSTRNHDVLDAFKQLSSDIYTLGDRIENLELRLDGKALVGGIVERTDRALGQRTIYKRRGV